MHSNDVFLQFLDWFNSVYNKPIRVESETAIDPKSRSYTERRQQMKSSSSRHKHEEQAREISRIEEELPQTKIENESRRSRYDQNYGHDLDGSTEVVKSQPTPSPRP